MAALLTSTRQKPPPSTRLSPAGPSSSCPELTSLNLRPQIILLSANGPTSSCLCVLRIPRTQPQHFNCTLLSLGLGQIASHYWGIWVFYPGSEDTSADETVLEMSCVVLVLGVSRPPAPTQLSMDRLRESSSLVHSLLLQTAATIYENIKLSIHLFVKANYFFSLPTMICSFLCIQLFC